MTEKHDYRRARDWAMAAGSSVYGSPFIRDAIIAALQAKIDRQEREEALERGEAVRVSAAVHIEPAEDGGDVSFWLVEGYAYGSDEAFKTAISAPNARISAIVPIPKPQEIEADVE